MSNVTRWTFFKCQRCGKCCRELGFPYSGVFFSKLAELEKITIEDAMDKYYGKRSGDGVSWEPEDEKRIPCPFLKQENDISFCSVYSIRPKGCELYPMYTDFGPGGVECDAYKDAIKKLRETQENEL